MDTSSASERPRVRPLILAVVLSTFAVVFATLDVVSYVQRSGTWDEPMHLTAGYMALVQQEYRVDPSHPPFLRMWAALPLLAMPRVTVEADAIARVSASQWPEQAYEFARRFLYVDNDADRLLNAGRFMVVVWGIVLGVLLFCWANEWLGFVPAAFALVFYTLEPNIAAHASLITTDLGVTCFIFGAVYLLWRTCRKLTAANIAGLATFSALACITKFSGLILWPIMALLLAIAALRRSAVSPRAALAVLGLAAAATFVAIWAVYGFRYAPSASGGWPLQFADTPLVRSQVPLLASAGAWLDTHRLLPNAFIQGFLYNQASVQQMPAFLAGDYRVGGWWYYFPVAFLIKTPSALLVLFVIGLVVYVRRRRELAPSNELFVVLPVVVYLAFAITSGINLGLRHILPVYPFVLLIAAAAAKEFASARSRVGRIALGALTIFWVVRFADIYPHTFTFFNRFVGGPRNGYKYLVDSNLDWGQHLKLLKRWMDDAGVSHINLAYFGTADPMYYGINCTYLPGGPTFTLPLIMRPKLPGYVAISATVLSGVYLQPRWRLFYRPFFDQPPVAEIGNSIRVYWVDRWPEPANGIRNPTDVEAHAALADALLFAQDWADHAVVHYREYVKHRPDSVDGWTKLGLALMANGETEAAIEALRQAVHLDPQNGQARRLLARGLLNRGDALEAGVHAEQAVALAPGDPDAHDLLGVALALQGRLGEAAIHFERALQIDPTHAAAREHLGRIRGTRR